MTSSSVWPKVGQTKQCREYPSTTISAHTARRCPVSGSWIRPSRPKSTSATSPGGVSPIRTVVLLRLLQFRFWMKRRSDWYDTGQPRPNSNS